MSALPQQKPLHSEDAQNEPAAIEFIEHMGLTTEADGMPRIAGRMWGFFILFGGPCSFAELAERLQVSRGSISTNARILRDLGIIERVAFPGDRQDYYQLADQPFDQMLLGYITRMRNTTKNVERAAARLPKDWTGSHTRLKEMGQFYESAIVATQDLVDTLVKERQA